MKNNSARKTGSNGFTLVEIMIVVTIVGLLAAIAIPNFIRARTRSQTNACINNLRQIDSAKQQWAIENRASGGATPTELQIGPYLNRDGSTANVLCPAGGAGAATFDACYSINPVSNVPTCKIDGLLHALP